MSTKTPAVKPTARRAEAAAAPAAKSKKESEPINLALDPSKRPLAGADIGTYMSQHRLERVTVVERLALASPGVYSNYVKHPDRALPFPLELLLRYRRRQPISPPVPKPVEVFNTIYGPLLARFELSDAYEPAKVMLFERFGAMLGRTVYSSYRWLKKNHASNYGEASGPLRRLFALLPNDADEMRRELEALAREAWKARGIEFDNEWPLPDPKNPPMARKPGPPAGARARRNEELAEEVAREVIARKRRAAKAADAEVVTKALKKAPAAPKSTKGAAPAKAAKAAKVAKSAKSIATSAKKPAKA